MRLTPRQHLRRTAEFAAVRAEGVCVDTRAFRFQGMQPAQPGLRRVGVIASRRIGGAVQRNRAKRLLREAFRLHQGQLPESIDFVLIARRAILGMSGAEVQQHFCYAVERLVRRTAQSRNAAKG